jgi:hypothetical protein
MQTSDQINELAAALAKAQGKIKGASKDADNPFFKSKYADLASVWEACRSELAANGLSIVQAPRATAFDGGWVIEVETRLLHGSGQWMADSLTLPVGKPDAQGVGSAITYARRYALASFVGVAPEDDDGNAAVKGTGEKAQQATPKVPAGFDDWFTDFIAVADEGLPALEAAWKSSKLEYRDHATKFYRGKLDAAKAKAGKVEAA